MTLKLMEDQLHFTQMEEEADGYKLDKVSHNS